jgi:hypothetical protein
MDELEVNTFGEEDIGTDSRTDDETWFVKSLMPVPKTFVPVRKYQYPRVLLMKYLAV